MQVTDQQNLKSLRHCELLLIRCAFFSTLAQPNASGKASP
jgi:hypothetical protein